MKAQQESTEHVIAQDLTFESSYRVSIHLKLPAKLKSIEREFLIRKIIKGLKKMDWSYTAYPYTSETFKNGKDKLKKIHDNIKSLARQDSSGLNLAQSLWNLFAPTEGVRTPTILMDFQSYTRSAEDYLSRIQPTPIHWKLLDGLSDIRQMLQKKMDSGDRYLVFRRYLNADKGFGLKTFSEQQDAIAFSFVKNVHRDKHLIGTIPHALNEIDKALSLQQHKERRLSYAGRKRKGKHL